MIGPVLALALAACAAEPPGWAPLDVKVRPAALSELEAAPRFGPLTFAGGVALSAKDERFGGLSGLLVEPDGRFHAITDAGDWVRGRLGLDAEGRLAGLEGAEIAPILDPDGRPLAGKKQGDAEGLARLPDGRLAVSFEQDPRIWIYAGGEAPGPAQVGPAVPEGGQLAPNAGLEALATWDDALLAGAERSPEGGETWWWRLPLEGEARGPAPAPLAPAFALVALDRLPEAFGGDFVAVERLFTPITGVRIRLSRVSAAALAAGRYEAELLAELATPLALDNFEGVSAVETPAGVRLYLVSDDNFSALQKTLIYAFDWPLEGQSAPADVAAR